MSISIISDGNRTGRKEGAAPPPTSRLRTSGVLVAGAISTASVAVTLGLYLVFFRAPVEATMGVVQKIFYFHVPAAWIMFVAVCMGAVASAVYLASRRPSADRLAQASLEIAALFGAMVLVTGPLWGYRAWGTPWEWDVRLTTFLVLELVLLAYLFVRAYAGPQGRALASAIAIFGAIQIPIVYFSVDLWRGQHPPRVVASGGLHPDMVLPLLVCLFAFGLLFAILLALRLALAKTESDVDTMHLLLEEALMEEK